MRLLTLLTLAIPWVVLTVPAHAAPYDTAVLSDNPAAYWRMNETSGTSALDSSGNSNTGTYFNGPTLGVSGALLNDPSNTAARYDGASDGAGSPTAATDHMDASVAGLGTNYSMEFWFRNDRPITGPGSLPIAGYIVGRGSGAALAYDTIGIWGTAGFPFGRLYIFSGAEFAQDGTSTPTVVNTWYHVGMTRSGSTVNLYLNGNLEITGTVSPTFGSSTQFTAGYRPDTGWPYMGDIDEFAVYNTVLTGADFMQHYLASIPEPASLSLLLAPAAALLRRRACRLPVKA